MRLAAASSDIELRARHLALGTEGPDQRVARELDEAAQHAAQRGATAAAAELADLAVLLPPRPLVAAATSRGRGCAPSPRR